MIDCSVQNGTYKLPRVKGPKARAQGDETANSEPKTDTRRRTVNGKDDDVFTLPINRWVTFTAEEFFQ